LGFLPAGILTSPISLAVYVVQAIKDNRENEMTKLDAHQSHCLANAAYFTAVRGRRPATRTRIEFPSLEAAREYAAGFGDGCTMIYAVTARGQADHITNA
jgi:hypothetical protein